MMEQDFIGFTLKGNGRITITETPRPRFERPWKNRAFQAVQRKLPRLTNALLREWALGSLQNHPVALRYPAAIGEDKAKKRLGRWLSRCRRLRLLYLLTEGALLPLTPVLALLPGPNVFFYLPALLFVFHLKSYRSLTKECVETYLNRIDFQIFRMGLEIKNE